MKSKVLIGFAMVVLLSTGVVFAKEAVDQGTVVSEVQAIEDIVSKEFIEIGNKICPVSGEKVGGLMGKGVKYEYNGKVYNLCCKLCVKDFKKDPEKYSKIAEDQVN